ncbi:hypothetical protein DUNSADRAFT_4695 [Dunaliella salina]|uniref:Guanylate cyclase domain-containing protein n=1 Tax=Dunaliella salina TaxID=3046 RepID=A0ABQ7H7I1_DUNSA|nr:hypothetical protein DUNSADRAFT_4695 [Dunaliella salina]|eukprot:KAF5842811.1 hypothetical protein DUNSADRAFT_4695 [Dunaliella salina]
MSSDGVVNPRGSQHQTEASSGPSNVVTASRTKRSGLAVEPSSRVMSLIQGTTTSAHDSISGEGALNRKGPRRRRKKLETRRTRNVTISHFHTLNAAAEFSKNGNKASKDDSTALLDADLTCRSSPALDPSQVHGPASVQLSALLSDDGSSSQQHPQQQQDGMHSSQSQHENDSDESCFLPVYPSLDRGMPDLEVPALQNLLDLPGANSPRESRSKRKHAYKRSQSSPLQGMDIISGLDSKGHTSSERGKSSTGCGSPSAVSWEGFSLTRNSTYESLDCTGNPECTSATASVADSYKTAGDSPDVLSCGAKLEPGAQQQAVPVPGEQQQQHEPEHQGWHNYLPQQQHYPHHQQHQQPHPPQLLTSSSRDEHSFCHLAAETSMEDGQQELYGSGMPSTELCWHEVLAMAITDPVTGHAALLLLQTDITSRALLESRMASLTESQLAMLEQMFPRHVLEYMVTKQPGQQPAQADTASHLASSHENVTILFTDIVGFTNMSKEVKPDQVMAYLNELFTAFDALVDTYEIYKVETAGDCYIAAGGLTKIDQDGFICIDHEPDPVEAAHRVLSFAKALLYCAKTVMMPHNGQPTRIRVGMHTGPAVTGLIGTKLPKYSVFGDTMNTASRMESSCPYGCIQISDSTHALLTDHPFKPTGGVEVKGKGRMETFIWDPEEKPNYTIPPDVVNAVVRAKEAVHEEEDASGYSLSKSLPLQGEFAERAQQHDMRYACAEDWSEIKRKSTGAASSTLSYKGAPHEMEGLHDLQQQGPQQEQAHAQYVRVRSAPLTQNRHPLTALHNLQSCFLLASPHPLGPMPQSPPCLPGQDPSWPRALQHGDAVLQPAGSRSSRSLGGSKYPSINNSKGDVPPGTGTPPSSDSMYSQLRQSLGDLAMGHHPLGSSRLSGSSSPFAKTSLTTRPRSQQQVDLGLGPAGMGQQVPRRASDNLGLGHLFQLPSSPRLPQGDAHAPQAGAPRVQHSSCQGLPGSAALAKPAERRLHSWTHSVVRAPQQASPAEPAKSSSPSPSSAGVAHTAEAQGPPPEAAAAASSMTPNAPSLKQPDIPTAMLQAHVKTPAALLPSYLLGGLDQNAIMPATAPRPPRCQATTSAAGSMCAPAIQKSTSEGKPASEALTSANPATHPNATPGAQRPMRRKPQRFMSQLVLQISNAEKLQSAAEAAAAPGWPDAPASPSQLWRPRTRRGSVTTADDASPPGAPGSHDTPASPSQLWRPRTRRGSVTIASDAALPGAAGCQGTLTSPFQVQHPRSRRGSVTIAGDAALQGAPGSHDTHTSHPFMVACPLSTRGSVTFADNTAPPGANGSHGSPASAPSLSRPSRTRRGSSTIAGDAAPQGAPGNHNTPASSSLSRRSRSRQGSVTIVGDAAPPGAPGSHNTPAGPSLLRRSLSRWGSFSRRGSVTIVVEVSPQDAPAGHDTPASPPSMSGHSFSRRGSVTFSEEAASVANSPVFSSAALCRQQLGGLGSARSRRASARSIECGTHSFSSTSNGGLDKTQMAGWTGDRTLSSGSKQSTVHHEHMRGGERALAPQDEDQPYSSSVRGGSGSQVMQTKNSFRLQQESGAVVEESEAAPPTFAACVPPAQGDPPAGRRSPSVLGQQLHSMLTSGAFAFPQHNNMRSVTAPQGRHEGLFPPQPQQAQRGRRSAELSRPASGRQRGAVSQLVRRSSVRLGMQHEPAKGAQESV